MYWYESSLIWTSTSIWIHSNLVNQDSCMQWQFTARWGYSWRIQFRGSNLICGPTLQFSLSYPNPFLFGNFPSFLCGRAMSRRHSTPEDLEWWTCHRRLQSKLIQITSTIHPPRPQSLPSPWFPLSNPSFQGYNNPFFETPIELITNNRQDENE